MEDLAEFSFFFFSSRRRHTRLQGDWSSDVCSSDLVVLGRHASEPPPDLLVCVVDATNLRLNLRLVLELKCIGRPILVALNMSDLAKQIGRASCRERV